MSRPVSEVIRRGFDNTVANWPLLLIRVGESMTAMTICLVTILAAVVPVIVTALRGDSFDIQHPEHALDLIMELITEHAMLIAYLIVLLTLLLTAILALRSFVEAGSTRIFIDGEAAADAGGKFSAFEVQRWFDAGKAGWWPVFLIYNIIGLVAILGALVPLFAVGLGFVAGGGAAAVIGCIVVPIVIISMIALAIVAALWNQKSIVVCVQRNLGALDAVRAGWRELMDDFPRHLGVGVLVAIIAFGAAAVLSVMSLGSRFGGHAGISLAIAPMQLFASMAQSAVSAVAGTWFIACFVALTVDNRR